MFSAPKIPSPEPKALGVDPSRTSSNEAAVPLPWAVGKNRLPLRWISAAFNQKTTNITQRVGKRNQTTGYNVYADIAAAICAGPVDQLEKILIDGVVVWASANAVRNGTNPHFYESTVPGFGTFRIYWGTSSQPKDTLILNFSAGTEITWDDTGEPWEFQTRDGTTNRPITYTTSPCPDDHPAYLDQCYMVWSQLFCGQNRESVPNVEVIVAKAARPFPELDPDITDEGVNPVFAVAEILTNELYGAGLPLSALSVTQWNGVATTAANLRTFARPTAPGSPVSVPFGHISPIVDRQVTVKQILNELFGYFDGWVRPKDGALEVGLFPHDGVTPTGLTTLSLQDDTALPEYQPGSWNDTLSQVTVTHRDYALDHKENAETCAQPLALAVTGQPQRENLSRPFFITRWQAQDYAARWARIHAHPANLVRGRIRVRTEKAVHSSGQPILAGDRFIFDYAPYSLQIVARVISRQDDSSGGEISLQFEAERGLAPLPYALAGDNRPTITQVIPTTIGNARIFQLPTGFLEEPNPAVVPLAERPAAAVVGFNAFFSTSGSSYDLLGTSQNWALRGTLVSGIAAGDTTLTLSASGLDIGKLQPQSTAAQADDTLLLFLGNEVLSIGTVTAIGGGQYTVGVLRGRFGSVAATHSTSAVAYVQMRAELAVYQNANFPRTALLRYFKFQSFTFNDQEDLSASLSLNYTFLDRAVGAPTGLTATSVAAGVLFEWTNPSEPDFDFTELYVSTTTTKPSTPTFLVPGVPGSKSRFRVEPVTAGETRYGWVNSVDSSGNKSPTGPGPVDAQASSAGSDSYSIALDMPAPVIRADAAGNAVSGELGSGGRVTTTVAIMKGTGALVATTGVPGPGQFRVLANGTPLNSTATFSGGNTIRLDTATADTGAVYYKVELEATTVFFALQWKWSKTKDGNAGAGYGGTSTSSLTLGTGSRTLTTQTGLAYTPGDLVRVKYTTDPAQWMEGVVTAYNSGTGSLTFTSNLYLGSGTFATWTLSLAGQSGTGGVYVGEYSAAGAYYQDSVRYDIVSVAGTYYRANNPAKSGLTTWGNPTSSADWISAGATLKFAASDLFLARDATVLKTLVMGDGTTSNAGIIRSAGATTYSAGVGFFLGFEGTTAKFRVGDPANYRIGYDGTNVEAVLKSFTLKPSASGTTFVVDTDSDFVGPNPPSRVVFGSFKLSGNGSGATTQTMSSGSGILFTEGTTFGISNNGYISASYQITLSSGLAYFKQLQAKDFIKGRNTADTADEFLWSQGVSLDVRGVNIRCLDSSGAVKAVMNQTSGNQGFWVDGNRIAGPRKTGWTLPTGTFTRTGFATGTATLTNVAEALAALINDLHASGSGSNHGILGT